MQTDLQIIQTLREAETRASYDANQAFGQRVLTDAGTQAEIARVSTPEQYAQSWVVTLAPVTTPGQQTATGASGFNPQVLADATAIIEWGMGGSLSWAVVDWTMGQQFSVFGSFVRVIANLNDWGPNGQPAGDAARTRFAGHIAPGRSIAIARRTIIYPAILTGTSSEQPVPAFARQMRGAGFQVGATMGFNLVRFRAARTPAGAFFWERIWGPTTNAAGPADVGLVLPVGSNFMSVFNATTGTINVVLTYDLALS